MPLRQACLLSTNYKGSETRHESILHCVHTYGTMDKFHYYFPKLSDRLSKEGHIRKDSGPSFGRAFYHPIYYSANNARLW
eukprot:scaffold2724_cov193-Amphora_coffeaeformis.AAC.5